MSKATIERRAKSAPAKRRMLAASQELASTAERIASDARERPYAREDARGVELSAKSVKALAEAIVSGIVAELEKMLPIMARIAAADTVHTCEHAATIFRRVIREGLRAAEIYAERDKLEGER